MSHIFDSNGQLQGKKIKEPRASLHEHGSAEEITQDN